MHRRASRAVVGMSLLVSLGLCGCTKQHEQPPVVAPERSGAEPTGVAPLVIVEAPPQQQRGCAAADPSGGELLIPEAAEWLVRIGPSQVMRSPSWALFGVQIEAENPISSLFGGLRGCGLEPAVLDDVWVGFETVNQNFVIVVHGPGIGRPELASCALRAMHEQIAGDSSLDAELPQQLMPSELGSAMMTLRFEDGAGYLLNPDELMLTSSGWQDHVTQLAQCIGRPAVEAGLAQPRRRVDAGAGVWGIGTPTGSAATALTMLGLPTPGYDLAFTVDFRRGIDFDISHTLDSAPSATQARSTLMGLLDQFAGTGQPLIDQLFAQLSVLASGPLLSVQGSISADQLSQLRDTI